MPNGKNNNTKKPKFSKQVLERYQYILSKFKQLPNQ